MKVKLLRKVRKRYSITRVDKLVKPCNDIWKHRKITYGDEPFYILEDSLEAWNTCTSSTFDTLYDRLIFLIKQEYKNTRETKIKQTKVWYNKQYI